MRLVILASMMVLCAVVSTSAQAQQSRCADCHFANMQPSFSHHVNEWDLSAHGRANVGCERCHGGDATTFEQTQAHRGIVAPTNPTSPLARANVPATCGTCHVGPFVAFQKSRHYELLRAGNRDVPLCLTCHGDAGSNLLSPKALENQCASCHGAGKANARPEYPANGRLMLQGIRDARAMLKEARGMIGRVNDRTRRARLEQAAQQVDVPLTQATEAGHAFVYDDLQDRLDTARRRLAALFNDLANPQGR